MSDLKSKIMEKIEKDEIQMRPRKYFKLKKTLFWLFLAFLIIISVFAINMMFYFIFREANVYSNLSNLANLFPYKYLLIGTVGAMSCYWALRQKTTIYRRSIPLMAVLFLSLFFASGYLLAASDINKGLENKAGLEKIYNQYRYENLDKNENSEEGSGNQEKNNNRESGNEATWQQQNQEKIQEQNSGQNNNQNQQRYNGEGADSQAETDSPGTQGGQQNTNTQSLQGQPNTGTSGGQGGQENKYGN
jgi:hypothetical protein